MEDVGKMRTSTLMPRALGRCGASLLSGTGATPLAFLLLAIAVAAGAWNFMAGQIAQTEAKRHRTLVIRSDRLLSTMKDLEIGERGYALTGKAS